MVARPGVLPAGRLKLAVSACLLGQPVRYDAGHRRHPYVAQILARHFELLPICPEVGIGLGVPRAPVRLTRMDGAVRVRGIKSPEADHSEALAAYAKRQAPTLAVVCGYVVKKNSPSCGMTRVKVYSATGHPDGHSAGAYTQAVQAALPLLPVEEEGRLEDPGLRASFVWRVYTYARWQSCLAAGARGGDLVDFHTRHKLLLLAHNQAAYRRMGRLVAQAGRAAVADAYASELFNALQRPATVANQANVLAHMAGYFRRTLDAPDRAELVGVIEAFRLKELPLAAVLTLLRHHLRRHPVPYLEQQVFLNPPAAELLDVA